MYVIASHGHCVINGLGQVKIWRDRETADQALAALVESQGSRRFEVQYVQIIEGDN